MTFEALCNWVVLLGAVTIAITNIYKFFANPSKKAKEKQKEQRRQEIKEVFDEELPDALLEHDKETRKKYLADRQKYLEDITDTVIEQQKSVLDEIKEANKKQNELLEKQSRQIEILNDTSRDVLREKIMGIYEQNCHRQALCSYDKRKLNQYYKDYKREGGNSYIDGYYTIMDEWDTLPDPHIKEIN